MQKKKYFCKLLQRQTFRSSAFFVKQQHWDDNLSKYVAETVESTTCSLCIVCSDTAITGKVTFQILDCGHPHTRIKKSANGPYRSLYEYNPNIWLHILRTTYIGDNHLQTQYSATNSARYNSYIGDTQDVCLKTAVLTLAAQTAYYYYYYYYYNYYYILGLSAGGSCPTLVETKQ
jgi:hypothetical protein